ncbi:MAG: DNA polymerase III subunit gamma/tau [Proteobacteria bacterium]|nr:DNA polymerase III subunit gamma/tau [Pseudomonadota bacterium]
MSAYQVLARKWRPLRFEDVKGQDHVVKTLKNSIINNRLAAAYIFSGSRGVGKTSVARLLAKAICCPNQKDGEPCNECASCIEITRSNAIDIQEIDGASNNGVDAIREIRENIMYPPVSAKYKIYIIDEVHMLSNSAFNALLKTLEEPPAHGIFIFATTEPHEIPQTIVSRCQSFDFKKLSVEDIVSTITNIVEKEGITASKQALYSIAREAKGSLRDSLSILDQVISFAGKTFDQNEVKAILGFVDRNIVFEIVKGIVENDPKKCMSLAKKLLNEAYDVEKISETIVEIFKELLFIKNGLSDFLSETLPDYELKELESIAPKTSATDIEQWFYMANKVAEDITRSSYATLLFEVGLLSMCNKPGNSSLEELISTLKNTNISSQPLNNEKKNNITANNDVSSTLDWHQLIQAISKRDIVLSDILARGKFIGIHQGRTVVVDYSDSPETLSKIHEKKTEYLKLIQDTIHELCGNIYMLDIRSNVLMQRMADGELKKKDLAEKEIVKSAIDMFGAKVKKVKLY